MGQDQGGQLHRAEQVDLQALPELGHAGLLEPGRTAAASHVVNQDVRVAQAGDGLPVETDGLGLLGYVRRRPLNRVTLGRQLADGGVQLGLVPGADGYPTPLPGQGPRQSAGPDRDCPRLSSPFCPSSPSP